MKIWENGIVREMTEEEIAEIEKQAPTTEQQILELQQKLHNTTDQAIKYAEGWLTDEEYEPIKLQRQEWRDEINRLQNEESEIK